MQSSRARSSSRASSSHKKPFFLTKYKERSGNRSVLNDSNGFGETDRKHSKSSRFNKTQDFSKMFLQRTFKNRFPLDESFAKTSRDIEGQNFNHHDPNLCVCQDCLCGRHLCKMHQVKPDLSKGSTYRKDFYRKHPIDNNINISKQYDRLQGPNFQGNTTYGKDFPGKKGDDLERPHPQDLLKNGGPSPNLTSYTSGFPGYRGVNQYVKPTDRHTRGNFPMKDRSTYAKSFLGAPGKKDDYDGIPDNLKTGYQWLGDTTYGDKYRQPNPEDYPAHMKNIDKLLQNPDFKRQYETTYRNNYLGERKDVCPAKTKLQTKIKGFFTNSKAKFSENTDYKALSPEYHAISTSKHSYV